MRWMSRRIHALTYGPPLQPGTTRPTSRRANGSTPSGCQAMTAARLRRYAAAEPTNARGSQSNGFTTQTNASRSRWSASAPASTSP